MAETVRIGQGLDVHAFSRNPGTRLLLGGVHVPEALGLDGHSDADVVLHALVDALLGAAGLGDLGDLVGIDEPETRGAPSSHFVMQALERVHDAGWRIANTDLTVVAQHPRLGSHRPAIRTSVAALLGVEEPAVNVKATTTDGLGVLGRGEGIACLAVVLLVGPVND